MFNCSFGTFQYISMQFDLANTGSLYSRMLDAAMKDTKRSFWMVYLDDILTFSAQPWAHFRNFSLVVLVHTAGGIKIQSCKNKLFQSEVEYLGDRISKEVHDT